MSKPGCVLGARWGARHLSGAQGSSVEAGRSQANPIPMGEAGEDLRGT